MNTLRIRDFWWGNFPSCPHDWGDWLFWQSLLSYIPRLYNENNTCCINISMTAVYQSVLWLIFCPLLVCPPLPNISSLFLTQGLPWTRLALNLILARSWPWAPDKPPGPQSWGYRCATQCPALRLVHRLTRDFEETRTDVWNGRQNQEDSVALPRSWWLLNGSSMILRGQASASTFIKLGILLAYFI